MFLQGRELRRKALDVSAPQERREQASTEKPETTRSSQPTSNASNSFVDTERRVNKAVTDLPIVPVKIKALGQDKVVETYVFLNNGSNTSFCTEGLMNELNLKRVKT